MNASPGFFRRALLAAVALSIVIEGIVVVIPHVHHDAFAHTPCVQSDPGSPRHVLIGPASGDARDEHRCLACSVSIQPFAGPVRASGIEYVATDLRQLGTDAPVPDLQPRWCLPLRGPPESA